MKHPIPTAPKTKAVLLALQRGEPLTVAKALRKLGVYALSQEIGRLACLGWKIKRDWLKTADGARVRVYVRGW